MSQAAALAVPEKLRALGAQFHEVTAALKDPGPGKKRRWFQGPLYCDLIVDFVEGELVRFELTFEGQWVAAERAQTSTGRTDELTADSAQPVSKLVTRDAQVSPALVAAAREVLSGLPDGVLGQALIAMLQM